MNVTQRGDVGYSAKNAPVLGITYFTNLMTVSSLRNSVDLFKKSLNEPPPRYSRTTYREFLDS